MALAINTQSNAFGVVNMAKGSIVTDAVAAVAQTFTLGFIPRKITVTNLTDRICDEWDEGMDLNAIYVNILGITAKLDADAGVTDTNYGALWNPVAVVTGAGGPTSAVPYDVAPQAASSLIQMKASITGILAKLDADAGVTDTNYTALWNPSTATNAALIASIAGLTAKLDADAGVTDTNYGALWGTVPVYMSLHTVANGTTTLEVTNGINVVGNTFSLTAATMVASKQFYWTAQG
jgi:hypothetical protein